MQGRICTSLLHRRGRSSMRSWSGPESHCYFRPPRLLLYLRVLLLQAALLHVSLLCLHSPLASNIVSGNPISGLMEVMLPLHGLGVSGLGNGKINFVLDKLDLSLGTPSVQSPSQPSGQPSVNPGTVPDLKPSVESNPLGRPWI